MAPPSQELEPPINPERFNAVPADDAEILKIAAWCAEHSITVIVGFCERTETKALSDKIGTDAPRYAFGVTGIPREDQAMTVRHSASAAERLCL
jgi:hypothetical protein